jgi:hypothetical protein
MMMAAPRRATRRRRCGGSSVEYLLVLALVVIPIALLSPLMSKMVADYAYRLFVLIRLPLG